MRPLKEFPPMPPEFAVANPSAAVKKLKAAYIAIEAWYQEHKWELTSGELTVLIYSVRLTGTSTGESIGDSNFGRVWKSAPTAIGTVVAAQIWTYTEIMDSGVGPTLNTMFGMDFLTVEWFWCLASFRIGGKNHKKFMDEAAEILKKLGKPYQANVDDDARENFEYQWRSDEGEDENNSEDEADDEWDSDEENGIETHKELAALRDEVKKLKQDQSEVAIRELRDEVKALKGLRDEVKALKDLREEIDTIKTQIKGELKVDKSEVDLLKRDANIVIKAVNYLLRKNIRDVDDFEELEKQVRRLRYFRRHPDTDGDKIEELIYQEPRLRLKRSLKDFLDNER